MCLQFTKKKKSMLILLFKQVCKAWLNIATHKISHIFINKKGKKQQNACPTKKHVSHIVSKVTYLKKKRKKKPLKNYCKNFKHLYRN